MNIMLDGLPTEYEGYLIRTDFRIGIQISQAFNDPNLAAPEKMMVALELLYGKGIPTDSELAESGIQWFMRGGEEESKPHASESTAPTFDFEQDNRLVYSVFRSRYNIDLTRDKLHWFAFLALLADIGECYLSQVIGIRAADTSKMSTSEQQRYARLKEKFRVQQPMSDYEKAVLAEFEDRLK